MITQFMHKLYRYMCNGTVDDIGVITNVMHKLHWYKILIGIFVDVQIALVYV